MSADGRVVRFGIGEPVREACHQGLDERGVWQLGRIEPGRVRYLDR
jgi:hypothetical protein